MMAGVKRDRSRVRSDDASMDFDIPPIPAPKPWHRIAVPPACPHRKNKKIWKRVGGLPSNLDNIGHVAAVAESMSVGQVSRKRGRKDRYVPSWSNVQWHTGPDDDQEGDGLAQARAMVKGAAAAAATHARGELEPKRGTFPEERLRWLPRKRDCDKRPIEIRVTSALGVEAAQDDAPSNAPQATPPDVDSREREKKRRLRRLSRRISLAPALEASDREPFFRREDPPAARRATMHATARSAKQFTIQATPHRVVLTPPSQPPTVRVEASLQSPPPSPSPEQDTAPNSCPSSDGPHRVDGSAPIIFGQDAAESLTESEHESWRRISFHKARHIDRRLSGVVKRMRFEPAARMPDRRHSSADFARRTEAPKRRTTLAAWGTWADPDNKDLRSSSSSNDEAVDLSVDATAAHFVTETGVSRAVDVDVRTNLDIFGSVHPMSPSPARKIIETTAVTTSTPRQFDTPCRGSAEPVSFTVSPCPRTPMLDTIAQTELRLTEDGVETEAVTAPSEQPDHASPFEVAVGDGSSSKQMVEAVEDEQRGTPPAVSFTPYCPQGLSPIMEESAPLTGLATLSVTANSPSDAAQPAREEAVAGFTSPEKHIQPRRVDIIPPAVQVTPDRRIGMVGDQHGACFAHSPSIITLSLAELSSEQTQMGSPIALAQTEEGRDEASAETCLATLEDEEDASSMSDDSSFEEDNFTKTNPIHLESAMAQYLLNEDEHVTSPNSGNRQLGELLSNASPPDVGAGFSLSADTEYSEAQPKLMVTLGYNPALAENIFTTERAAGVLPCSPDAGAAVHDMLGQTVASRVSGFTPINHSEGRSRASLISPPPFCIDGLGQLSPEDAMDGADSTENALKLDLDEPAAEAWPSTAQDDSDTELLRKFVGRVKADKSAKDKASARAEFRSKRRSGSIGSTAVGSPIAKADTPSRTPLGLKDLNSPSPTKKRKPDPAYDSNDGLEPRKNSVKTGTLFDVVSPPKMRKRQKRIEVDNAAIMDPEYQPTLLSGDAAPRRSTRARSTKIQLRPTSLGPTAADDAAVMSMLCVRLPGSAAMMSETDVSIAMARCRKEEKDLAAVTRVNTRKNRGESVPPRDLLAQLTDDATHGLDEPHPAAPTAGNSRETSAEAAGGADSGNGSQVPEVRRKAKEVRWAEVLVRVQGDEAGQAKRRREVGQDQMSVAVANAVEPPIETEERDAELSIVAVAEKAAGVVESVEEEPEEPKEQAAADNVSKVPVPRRTRVSRLKAPTPRRSLSLASTSSAAHTPARLASSSSGASTLPRVAEANASVGTNGLKKAASIPAARTTTRRTRIASLGMGVNGTPAPKRRTRGAAVTV